MTEYRTLRAEVLHSLAMQQSSLAFGTLALGGLTLAGFHDWNNDGSKLPLMIFLLVVPLVSYVNGCIWLGEYARTMRAGFFLAWVEAKVNGRFGSGAPALTWERWLRTKGHPSDPATAPLHGPVLHSSSRPQYIWNSLAIYFYFLALVPIVSVVVGNISAVGLELRPETRMLVDAAEAAVFVIVFWSSLKTFWRARELARDLPSELRADAHAADRRTTVDAASRPWSWLSRLQSTRVLLPTGRPPL